MPTGRMWKSVRSFVSLSAIASWARLRSVMSLTIAMRAVGLPSASRIAAPETSPGKWLPSFLTKVYSMSRVTPSSNVRRRLARNLG